MNIWLVNQYAISPQEAGITRHYSLGRVLARRGHRMTIIASSFDHVTRQEAHLQPHEHFRIEEHDGVRFLWLRTPTYTGNTRARINNMLAFALKVLLGTGTQRLERPDLIVGSSPHLFGAVAAKFLADRTGAGFVLEIRDLWPQSLVELGNYSSTHPLVHVLERLERYLYRSADGIVSVLPGAKGHIVDRGGNGDMFEWVSNGVDPGFLVEGPPPGPGADFKVVYAGSFNLANGIDAIVETARLLADEPQVQFLLYGDGPEKARIAEVIRERRLGNVTLCPPLPKKEIHRALSCADAFIATSRNLGLYHHGVSFVKLYDYLACARPIVFGCSAGNPVAESGGGVVVPAEDPAAMARAVLHLKGMRPDERQAMGELGRQFVLAHFSNEILAGRLEHLLLKVMAGRQPGWRSVSPIDS
ncbi:hypothetical protein DEIPH_ctg026orf0021 [Deinococcus phoenicis]|uniref:Glycosyltransferase subfamily 4-like N-terminal domain-containing protein n=1 Tax=Deinococcus phoenicis TaxID=1476583 RepID=A0A016QPS2_9DEIO|nr:glycosyltransferase family 4 protein [Deinococcus phoenicis]EYB68125.1 hypothetical protein DEIPH_ctg026orf0021 [Deinococcus phoenicis]